MVSHKFATALSFGVLAVSMAYAHDAGRLFPGFSTGVLVATLILLIHAVRATPEYETGSLVWHVLPVVTVSVVYRVYIFLFSDSLVGVDPPTYASEVAAVIRSGTTEAITLFFYSDAPLFVLFPGLLGLGTGVDAAGAMILYPLLGGLLPPVAVAALTARIASENEPQKAVVAACLMIVMATSVRFGYWPIAQSLGIAYWTVFVVLAAIFIETKSRSILLLTALVLVAQVFTHKLPLLVTVLVLVAFVVILNLEGFVGIRNTTAIRRAALLAGLTGVLLIVQWVYMTVLIRTFVFRTIEILSVDSVTVSPPLVTEPPSAAASPPEGVVGILSRNAYMLGTLFTGGVCWLWVAIGRSDRAGVRFLLAGMAVPVALVGISIVAAGGADTPSPFRIISFVEAVVVPLIAIAVTQALVTGRNSERVSLPAASQFGRRLLAASLVLALLFTQVYSPVAVPDSPADSRYYLTSREVQGKAFGYEYAEEPIHTDWFVTISGPPTPGLGADSEKYTPIGAPLLNANLTEQEYEQILLRTDVGFYRTTRGPWRLLWDPAQRLDPGYNRVYTNGGVILYNTPRPPP
jgi:hypothetical protein